MVTPTFMGGLLSSGPVGSTTIGTPVYSGTDHHKSLSAAIAAGTLRPEGKQLPGDIAHCMIDGVKYYRQAEHGDDHIREGVVMRNTAKISRETGAPADQVRAAIRCAYDCAHMGKDACRASMRKLSGASERLIERAMSLVPAERFRPFKQVGGGFSPAAYDMAKARVAGGNIIMGGSAGGCGCGDMKKPWIAGGAGEVAMSDLKEYEGSVMSSTKQQLAAKFIAVGERLGLIKGSGSQSDKLKELAKAIPNVFKSSAEASVIKAFADAVNAEFGNVIDAAHPQLALQQIAELVLSLSAGMYTEFLGVYKSVRHALGNIEVLRGIMKQQYDEQLALAKSEATGDKVEKIARIEGVYKLVSDEIDLQHNMLKQLLNVELSPAERDLASLVSSQKDVMGFLEKIDVKNPLGKFGKTISDVLRQMGVTSEFALLVDKALKRVGMTVAEYTAMKTTAGLREKVLAGLVGRGDKSVAELDDFLAAADLLERNFYRAEEIAGALKSRGVAGGDDGEEQDEYNYGGGARHPTDNISGGLGDDGYPRSNLDKRVDNIKRVKNLVFEAFISQVNRMFDAFIVSLDAVTRAVGREMPISDELDKFRKAVVRFETSESFLKKRNMYLALTGYYNDALSRSKKEELVNELRDVKAAVERLIAMPSNSAAREKLSAVVAPIDGILGLIAKYSEEIAQKFGKHEKGCKWIGDDAEAAKAGGGMFTAEERDHDAVVKYKPSKSIKDSVQQFDYFYRVARIRQNLKLSGAELKNYGEKYDGLVRNSITQYLADENEKYKKIRKNLEGRVEIVKGSHADVKKHVKDAIELLDDLWRTKGRFWDTVHSVDKYMQVFTDGLVNNPNDIKDIKSMLDSVEIISKWYSNATGKYIVKMFGHFPHDKTPAANGLLKPADDDETKDHYYVEDKVKDAKVGNPNLATGATHGREAIKDAQKVFANMYALKNLISVFQRIGANFGGAEISKKVDLSPAQIYNNLANYIQFSAFTQSRALKFDDGAKKWKFDTTVATEFAQVIGGVTMRTVNDADAMSELRNEWSMNFAEEDKFFVLMLKSMAAKILTITGMFNIFDRPAEYNGLSPIRMIIGGGYAVTPKLEEAAVPLYHRLPWLAEFYKKLFEYDGDEVNKFAKYDNVPRRGNDSLKISLVPDFEGPFAGLIGLMYRKNQHLKLSEYTDDDMRELMREINIVYQRMAQKHSSDVVRGTIDEFVAEVNKRYGVISKSERDAASKLDMDLRRMDYAGKTGQFGEQADDNLDIVLLEGEDEPGVPRPTVSKFAPIDSVVSRDRKSQYAITDAYRRLVYNFRCMLDKELAGVKNDSTAGESFDGSIKETQARLKRETDDEKRFALVCKLVRGNDMNNTSDGFMTIMFHETVVAGLNLLSGINTLLCHLKVTTMVLDPRMHFTKPAANPAWANAAGFATWMTSVLEGLTKNDKDFAEVAKKIRTTSMSQADHNAAVGTLAAAKNKASDKMIVGLNLGEVMKELVKLLCLFNKDFQGLVSVSIDKERLNISAGGLKALVDDLFSQISIFGNILRPHVKRGLYSKYFDKTSPGSFYWLQEQLLEKHILGKRENELGADQKERSYAYESLEDVFARLSYVWRTLHARSDTGNLGDALAAEILNVSPKVGAGAAAASAVAVVQKPETDPYEAIHFALASDGRVQTKMIDTRMIARWNLYNWDDKFEGGSCVQTFNELIAKYIYAFFDPVSGKIYNGLVDKFATGPFNKAVSDYNSCYPDTAPMIMARGAAARDAKIPNTIGLQNLISEEKMIGWASKTGILYNALDVYLNKGASNFGVNTGSKPYSKDRLLKNKASKFSTPNYPGDGNSAGLSQITLALLMNLLEKFRKTHSGDANFDAAWAAVGMDKTKKGQKLGEYTASDGKTARDNLLSKIVPFDQTAVGLGAKINKSPTLGGATAIAAFRAVGSNQIALKYIECINMLLKQSSLSSFYEEEGGGRRLNANRKSTIGSIVNKAIRLFPFDSPLGNNPTDQEYKVELLAHIIVAVADAKSKGEKDYDKSQSIFSAALKEIRESLNRVGSTFQHVSPGQKRTIVKYDEMLTANKENPDRTEFGTSVDENFLVYARSDLITGLSEANSINDFNVKALATYNSAEKFGDRPDPDGGHILFASLADIFKNIITSKTNAGQLFYAAEAMADVPLYMKEKMRANLPMFRNMFKELANRCDLLKRIAACEGFTNTRARGAHTHIPFPFTLSPHATDAAANKKRFVEALDSIIRGCMVFTSTCEQVLKEVGDNPLYFETYQNSIKDYKSQYGSEPFAPLSFALAFMRGDANEHRHAIPVWSLGTPEFKFNYGVRSLLHNPTAKPLLEYTPSFKELVNQFNITVDKAAEVDDKRAEAFLDVFARAARFLYGAFNVKGFAGGADHISPIAVKSDGTNMTFKNYGDKSLGNRSCATIFQADNPEPAKDIKPVFAIRQSLDELTRFVESSFKDDKIKELVKYMDTDAAATTPDMSVRNIVDLDIVPVNVHALMREVPLVNLYNYAYTFDRLIVDLLIHDDKKRDKFYDAMCAGSPDGGNEYKVTTKVVHGGASNAVGALITNPREAFVALLLDPYMAMQTDSTPVAPGFSTDVYNKCVKPMLMGSEIDELGRPKFLSDQILNKAIFGELYTSKLYGDKPDRYETGPRGQLMNRGVYDFDFTYKLAMMIFADALLKKTDVVLTNTDFDQLVQYLVSNTEELMNLSKEGYVRGVDFKYIPNLISARVTVEGVHSDLILWLTSVNIKRQINEYNDKITNRGQYKLKLENENTDENYLYLCHTSKPMNIAKLRTQIDDQIGELNGLLKDTGALFNDATALGDVDTETDLKDYINMKSVHADQVAETEKVNKLRAEVVNIEGQIAKAEDEKAKLIAAYDSVKRSIGDLSGLIETNESKMDASDIELTAARVAATGFIDKHGNLLIKKADGRTLSEDEQALLAEYEAGRVEISMIEDTITTLTESIERLSHEMESLNSKSAALGAQIDDKEKSIDALSTQRGKLGGEYEKALKSLENSLPTICMRKTLIDDIEKDGYELGAKISTTATKLHESKKTLKKQHGVMNNVIKRLTGDENKSVDNVINEFNKLDGSITFLKFVRDHLETLGVVKGIAEFDDYIQYNPKDAMDEMYKSIMNDPSTIWDIANAYIKLSNKLKDIPNTIERLNKDKHKVIDTSALVKAGVSSKTAEILAAASEKIYNYLRHETAITHDATCTPTMKESADDARAIVTELNGGAKYLPSVGHPTKVAALALLKDRHTPVLGGRQHKSTPVYKSGGVDKANTLHYIKGNEIKEAVIADPAKLDALATVGAARFNTLFIRNLVFITNVYRAVLISLSRGLMYSGEIITRSFPILKPAITEFRGNQSITDTPDDKTSWYENRYPRK